MAEPSVTPALGIKAVPSLLRRIGDYDITGVLGRGGFGVVYAAEQRAVGERFAIKVLAPELAGDDDMIKRFMREAEIVRALAHPSIIQANEIGRLPDGRPYFVMDRVNGLGLHQLIGTLGVLPLADIVKILEPVCDALDAAHRAGVVHRDLKAANLIVSAQSDGTWKVWLTDFGIAKLLDIGGSKLTIAGQRLGTPEYMAPEQVLGGDVDGRTDIYALGILLYHMLTGSYPFRHTDPEEVENMQVSAVPVLDALPPALAEIIGRALEKLPRRRHPNARAFHAALRTVAENGPQIAAPGAAPAGTTPTRSIAGRPRSEIAVAVLASGDGDLPELDPVELARGTGGAVVELRTFDTRTTVCVIREGEGQGHGKADDFADDVAKVALQMRRAAPDAPLVVRLAEGGPTDLHVAFNAAMAAVAPPEIEGAIAIDNVLAERLEGRHAIEHRQDSDYLVPRPE